MHNYELSTQCACAYRTDVDFCIILSRKRIRPKYRNAFATRIVPAGSLVFDGRDNRHGITRVSVNTPLNTRIAMATCIFGAFLYFFQFAFFVLMPISSETNRESLCNVQRKRTYGKNANFAAAHPRLFRATLTASDLCRCRASDFDGIKSERF